MRQPWVMVPLKGDEMLDRIDLADGAETKGAGVDEPGAGRELLRQHR
ncbi:hypothetical protein [Streptomyces sp. NPDC088246]